MHSNFIADNFATPQQSPPRTWNDYARLFDLVFGPSVAGMLSLNSSGKCVWVNRAFCNFLGRTKEEVLAGSMQDITHPEDRDKSQQMLARLFRGELKSDQLEKRYLHKDGRSVWVLMTAVLIAPPGDLEGGYSVGIANDISKRKQTEEALRQSEVLFRNIGEHTRDLILIVDHPGHKIVYASSSFEKLLGYSPSELKGQSALQLIHPRDVPKIEQEIENMAGRGAAASIEEVRYSRKDGSFHDVESHACSVRNASGELERIVVIARDITERKAAQEAERQAHQQAELFINSVPSILIAVDGEARIKRWNSAACRTFGLCTDNVIGKHLADCGIAWVRADMAHEIHSWCSGGPRRVDALPFKIDGETRFLGLSITEVRTIENQVDEFLIIGSDVTEREILGQQLRQAQKLEAIGQLAAGIAHEINTPTQYVGDNARFLQESWPSYTQLFALTQRMRAEAATGKMSPQTLEEFDSLAKAADFDYLQTEIPRAIEQSLDGVQRVAKIVRAMKEFSHPGSEEKRPIDVNKAIETTITVARNEWKYVSDVETHFDPNLPLVPAHAGEFNQVILNLLINAAHAIGQVVGDGSQAKGKIVVSTQRNQDWVHISISDTGAGIPDAIRSRVFEPFFTTKPVGKGTGQGLALAHTAVVRRHGGKIWFDSQVGKGTTFYIQLPLGTAQGA